MLTPQQKAAMITQAARSIGANPVDLARVISYETEGTFSPSLTGGAGGNYTGLIQFGPSQARQYGVSPDQSFQDQLSSATRYLTDRGFQPGMNLADMYSIVNAGSLDANGQPRWSARDQNGTLAEHVARMQSGAYDGPIVQAAATPVVPPVPTPRPAAYDPAQTASLMQAMGYAPPPSMTAGEQAATAEAHGGNPLWQAAQPQIPFSSGATQQQIDASGYMPKQQPASSDNMAARFADAFAPAPNIAEWLTPSGGRPDYAANQPSSFTPHPPANIFDAYGQSGQAPGNIVMSNLSGSSWTPWANQQGHQVATQPVSAPPGGNYGEGVFPSLVTPAAAAEAPQTPAITVNPLSDYQQLAGQAPPTVADLGYTWAQPMDATAAAPSAPQAPPPQMAKQVAPKPGLLGQILANPLGRGALGYALGGPLGALLGAGSAYLQQNGGLGGLLGGIGGHLSAGAINGATRSSYGGGNSGVDSRGYGFNPSSVSVGGQTFNPISGSTVISPGGTVMSPSEYVNAMQNGQL